MSARTRTCRDCGRRWPQRAARFCGWCGAPLGDPEATRTPRRRRSALTTATRALAIVGLLGLAAIVMSLDLSRPEPNPTVDLGADEVEASPSPLSRDEADSLRAQADPQALRCEPRGCERWRLQLAVAQDARVVELEAGPVVVPLGIDPDTTGIVAIDPVTADTMWRFNLSPASVVDGLVPAAQVYPGPDGVLAYAGSMLASVGADGEPAWVWSTSEIDRPDSQLWHHRTFDDIVVVEGLSGLNGARPQRLLVGLDPEDGSVRWSRAADHATIADAYVAASSDDGVLEGLDPATGATLWRGPELGHDDGLTTLGPWLLVSDSGGDAPLVIDGDDGRIVDSFDGVLLGGPLELDDGLVVVVGDRYPGELGREAPRVAVVRFGDDGTVAWRNGLGPVDDLRGCCRVRTGPLNTVLVSTGPEDWTLHLEHGGTISVSDTTNDGDATNVRQLRPGVDVVSGLDPRSLEVRTPDGAVTVRSDRPMRLVADDPAIVSDGRDLLGLRLPE